jgi:hypothetical protein
MTLRDKLLISEVILSQFAYEKRHSNDSAPQLCMVIPLVGARSITTHSCTMISYASSLELWCVLTLSWCVPL